MKKPGLIFFFLITSHYLFCQTIFPQRDSLTKLFGYKHAYNSPKWIINPTFDYAEAFRSNTAIVATQLGLGLINKKGAYIIAAQYEELSGEKYFTFKKDKERGIIDKTGKTLFSGDYDHIYFEPLTGSAILTKDHLYGYWDTTGNFIAPLSKYEIAFNNNVGYFNSGKVKGFINKKGEKIIEVEEGDIWDIIPYGFLSKKRQRECLYDMTGKMIGQCDFDSIIQLRKDFILFYKDDQYGIINYKGETLLSGTYDYMSPFNEQGISVVRKDNLYGLINEKFEVVMPIDNQKIEDFGNTYNRFYGKYRNYFKFTIYKKYDHFGVINDSGRVIIEPQYDMAMIDGNHLLKFVYKDRLGVNDLRKLEKLPLTATFDFINDKTIFCINNNDVKCGMARKDGKIIVMPVYTSITPTVNGYAIVKNNNGIGIIDSAGKSKTSLVYSEVKTLDDIYKNYFHHTGDFVWDGFLYVRTKHDKIGISKENGELAVDTSYKNVTAFDTECNCWFVQNKKEKWDIVSGAGKKYSVGLDTPSLYTYLRIAVAKKNNLYGLINSEGKTVFPFKHKKIIPQSNNLFYFMTDSLWGIVNDKGEVISKPVYKNISLFMEGVSFAKAINGWGTVDSSGKFRLGYNRLAQLRKYKTDFRTDSLDIWDFSFNFKESDVVDFSMLVSHSNVALLNKVNDMILDKTKNILDHGYESGMIMFSKNTHEPASDLYFGWGIQIVDATANTITLNNFTEQTMHEETALHENYDVFFISSGSLNKVNIKNLVKTESDTLQLKNLILTKLKILEKEAIGKISLSDDLNFQISKKGIVFRVSDLIEKKSDPFMDIDIILSYEEIKFFVKRDGVLGEFY